MLKAPKEFIDDLKALFEKHSVIIEACYAYSVFDEYDGIRVEIKSVNYEGDELPIYIDDIEELSKQIST